MKKDGVIKKDYAICGAVAVFFTSNLYIRKT